MPDAPYRQLIAALVETARDLRMLDEEAVILALLGKWISEAEPTVIRLVNTTEVMGLGIAGRVCVAVEDLTATEYWDAVALIRRRWAKPAPTFEDICAIYRGDA